MLEALEHRYARQEEAMRDAMKSGAKGKNGVEWAGENDPNTLVFDEDLPDTVLRSWGFHVAGG